MKNKCGNCGIMRDRSSEQGKDLPEEGNRYQWVKELGCGGTARVYLATDLRLQKQWACKQIPKEDTAFEKETGEELPAEIQQLRKLDHPALPRIVDYFEDATSFTIVMDYVEGETLAEYLRRHGPVEERLARNWMLQLSAVLAYLHEQRPPLVYCDLKPSNIIRKPNGSLVLLDLGSAKRYGTTASPPADATGTRGYAAPEQYQTGPVDVRADLYALGITILQLLSGVAPAKTSSGTLPTAYRSVLEMLSFDFQKWLRSCVAPHPEGRPANGRILWEALRKPATARPHMALFRRIRRPALLGLIILLEWTVLLRPQQTDAAHDSTAEQIFREGQEIFFDTAEISFRERVLRAGPVFEEALALAQSEGNTASPAESYVRLCRFCEDYLFADRGLQEPDAMEYPVLLEAIGQILLELPSFAKENPHLSLLLLQSMEELILEYRQGFAWSGIPQTEVLQIWETIQRRAEETQVTRQSLLAMQNEILTTAHEGEEKIRAAYRQAERWQQITQTKGDVNEEQEV